MTNSENTSAVERVGSTCGGVHVGQGVESDDGEREELRPPLPPRPSLLQTSRPTTPGSSLSSPRPTLQSKATTALSSIDIQTLSFPDGSRGTFSAPSSRNVSESVPGLSGSPRISSWKVSRNGGEVEDNASLVSYAPTLRANGDLASLLNEGLNSQSPAWRLLSTQTDSIRLFETTEYEDTSLADFEHEFDEIQDIDSREGNEGEFI